ncbi:hypothetical protein PspLS_11952 [Pyricularia sp. CBS 133598]|nr:hypothetical protein PspLS_11952 [Pyricularia sp. CBS 133598]
MSQLDLISHFRSFVSGQSFWHFLLFTGFLVSSAVYNVYFHPLAKYPGPSLWAASQIPYAAAFSMGHGHHSIDRLHRKYGKIVRIAPDRLSFTSPESWNEIMGHQKDRNTENGKAPNYYDPMSIPGVDRENHARQRRVLAVGFSAKYIIEQQAIIHGYVGMLVEKLKEFGQGGSKPLDMVTWFNCTTFDIVGDLAFGDSFGSLKAGVYHPWVSLIFVHVKLGAYNYAIAQFPLFAKIIQAFVPKSITDKVAKHHALTRDLVDRRLAADSPRLDLMRAMSHPKAGLSMTRQEIYSNTGTLVVAGSETTATALSGILYYLLKTPNAMKKVQDEIRNTFSQEDEINYISAQKLNYLTACIREGLRIYPAIPSTVPRVTPKEGSVIFGEHVPANTKLDIWQWPMSLSEEYFRDANKFVPERWLGDPKYESDCREASQPFSVGPRDCLGKNLAYGEMRIILTRLIWNFDMRLADDSLNWHDGQKVYILWFKPPLNVHLTPVKRR